MRDSNHLLLEDPIKMTSIIEPSKSISILLLLLLLLFLSHHDRDGKHTTSKILIRSSYFWWLQGWNINNMKLLLNFSPLILMDYISKVCFIFIFTFSLNILLVQ
ncbi:hypothetical protein NC651_017939 [Populus alba x Populus x berolinensis]|nr:hypothetical protein NC651_017939 [Populus alba x Populus x berolinensis]